MSKLKSSKSRLWSINDDAPAFDRASALLPFPARPRSASPSRASRAAPVRSPDRRPNIPRPSARALWSHTTGRDLSHSGVRTTDNRNASCQYTSASRVRTPALRFRDASLVSTRGRRTRTGRPIYPPFRRRGDRESVFRRYRDRACGDARPAPPPFGFRSPKPTVRPPQPGLLREVPARSLHPFSSSPEENKSS